MKNIQEIIALKIKKQQMERETGFEPATYTLARYRSTNWAIPAIFESYHFIIDIFLNSSSQKY